MMSNRKNRPKTTEAINTTASATTLTSATMSDTNQGTSTKKSPQFFPGKIDRSRNRESVIPPSINTS